MNGILLIDKPSGPTSHDVVDRVRRKLGIKKVGHAGTLDPIATGLLVLGIGKGTRILEYFLHADKVYRAQIKLGIVTETFDITGEIKEEHPCNVTESEVVQALKSLQGEFLQVPPAYSARKYKGRKLYELAREGKIIRLPPRRVFVHKVEVIQVDLQENLVEALFKVSSGTYIRSLCMELGYRLGCGAVMNGLTRIQQGPFKLESAVKLEDVSKEIEAVNYHVGEAMKKVKALANKLAEENEEEVAEALLPIYQALYDVKDMLGEFKEYLAEELAERRREGEEGKLGLSIFDLL